MVTGNSLILWLHGRRKKLVTYFLFEVDFNSTKLTAAKDQIMQMHNYIYQERLCCYLKQY